MNMKLTCFEYSVIESILKKHAPELLHWLSDLEVESREHTIVGCYVNLVTNRQNKKIFVPEKFKKISIGSDLYAYIQGMKHGVGFILYITDGFPDCLEIFSQTSEEMPKTVAIYNFEWLGE